MSYFIYLNLFLTGINSINDLGRICKFNASVNRFSDMFSFLRFYKHFIYSGSNLIWLFCTYKTYNFVHSIKLLILLILFWFRYSWVTDLHTFYGILIMLFESILWHIYLRLQAEHSGIFWSKFTWIRFYRFQKGLVFLFCLGFLFFRSQEAHH